MKLTPDINQWLRSHPVSSARGAPMGEHDQLGGDTLALLYLQRLRFSDLCYDLSGVYWGLPADVWCAFDACYSTRLYVRAPNRAQAHVALLKRYPNLKFKKD